MWAYKLMTLKGHWETTAVSSGDYTYIFIKLLLKINISFK